MFSRAVPAAVFLEPQGSPPWREPAFGAAVLLMFALFGVHRLLLRGRDGLFESGRHRARPPAATGEGPRSALSLMEGVSGPLAFTGSGAEGFLRAALVEVVVRGRGLAVLGGPESGRLLDGRLEPSLLSLLASRLMADEDPGETWRELERRLSSDETEHFYWFLLPERAPEPLPEHERLHILLLGVRRSAREIRLENAEGDRGVPALTVAEAVERLHLFALTL